MSGPPRWVKVLGLVALVLVGLAIVLVLIVDGDHGPARHAPTDTQAAASIGIATAALVGTTGPRDARDPTDHEH